MWRSPFPWPSGKQRDQLVDLLHVERVAIELIEKNRVEKHARDLRGWWIADDHRPIGFSSRPAVAGRDREDSLRSQMHRR